MEKKNLIWTGLGLAALTGIGSWLLKKKTEEKQEQEKTENKKNLSIAELLEKYNVPKFFGGNNCKSFYDSLIDSKIVYTLYVWEDEHGKEWLIPKKFRAYPNYIEYQGITMSLEEQTYRGLLERYYLSHSTKRYYFDLTEEEPTKILLGYGILFDLVNNKWIIGTPDNKIKIYQINEEIHKIFENIWEKGEGILNIRKDKFLEDLESVLKKGN